MNQSAPKPRKKRATKKVVSDSITIMNVSKHSFWTGTGRVDPNDIVECDRAIGESIIKGGLAQEYKTGE